jgi:methionyl-tRNA synthetase
MEKYYLTTAIDYANAEPHIGHAYEKLGADVTARFRRLCGFDVFFLTGTDEHGSKVEKAAAAAGKTPQQFVDEVAAKFQKAWDRLGITYDCFIRTTEPRHEKVVDYMFRVMKDKGDIYKGTYTGLYCEGCEDWKNPRDLVDGKCPNHDRPPIEAKEDNYFFRLTKYKEPLRKWLTSQVQSVKPEFRAREVLNQLDDEEFGDFSLSRPVTSLKWGIPVPDDPDHVIYVWIDALTNYITGVGYRSDEKMWQRYWPCDLHLIGKDIVKFHCLYWPAMLMSAGIELPRLVFSHGFITVEGQKMSKTIGNVLDPIKLADTYPVDAIRYYIFAKNTFSHDADFSEADLKSTCNAHLSNGYGNLLNRTLKLVEQNCEGKVPEGAVNKQCLQVAEEAAENYMHLMAEFEFAKALDAVRSIVDEANRYINDEKPWALFKEGKQQEGAAVLLTSLELLRSATILYAPFIPDLANKVWHQLGFSGDIQKLTMNDGAAMSLIPKGQVVHNDGPPFPRLESPVAAKP